MMSVLINILIAVAIFGYSGWILYRHVQKGKQGACAGCDKGKSCQGASQNSSLSCCSTQETPPPSGLHHGNQVGM
ncbi:FeoB-associated Cys-rich membrane protein [Paenibacillus durus]|uniref:FeoB-associated Cys-rich membrane protein n=1 Tax=Paenibacillus durus TaxID=44251 RepID=UPI000ADEA3D7|nr:FeoB-associated Cys-rich membrane protein [Paenibacillus durus]